MDMKINSTSLMALVLLLAPAWTTSAQDVGPNPAIGFKPFVLLEFDGEKVRISRFRTHKERGQAMEGFGHSQSIVVDGDTLLFRNRDGDARLLFATEYHDYRSAHTPHGAQGQQVGRPPDVAADVAQGAGDDSEALAAAQRLAQVEDRMRALGVRVRAAGGPERAALEDSLQALAGEAFDLGQQVRAATLESLRQSIEAYEQAHAERVLNREAIIRRITDHHLNSASRFAW